MASTAPTNATAPTPQPDTAETENAILRAPVAVGRAKLELEAVRRIRKTYGRL